MPKFRASAIFVAKSCFDCDWVTPRKFKSVAHGPSPKGSKTLTSNHAVTFMLLSPSPRFLRASFGRVRASFDKMSNSSDFSSPSCNAKTAPTGLHTAQIEYKRHFLLIRSCHVSIVAEFCL